MKSFNVNWLWHSNRQPRWMRWVWRRQRQHFWGQPLQWFLLWKGLSWVELCGFCSFCNRTQLENASESAPQIFGARCEMRDAIYCLPLLSPVIVARELAKERAHKYRLNGMNEWFICVHRLGHISALIYAVTWQKPARRSPSNDHLLPIISNHQLSIANGK